ncbi:MAG: hypothetical protein LBL26_03245 [Peptococcaceae bacterium]|jgi:REP element-mobilizing transposase RayT|nr:hypothetical protein [Peptococcaceae bacterium]
MYPSRKSNRLKDYDYSRAGAYFLTICAKGRLELFSRIVVRETPCRSTVELTDIGKIIAAEIEKFSDAYDFVTVEHYVIMPNHVHMIVLINGGGRQNAAPTVPRMIKQWKRAVSLKVGYSIWQRSFYDHVVRNENDHREIMEYIENNPAKWDEDRYHP